jgi:hypothetical protein
MNFKIQEIGQTKSYQIDFNDTETLTTCNKLAIREFYDTQEPDDDRFGFGVNTRKFVSIDFLKQEVSKLIAKDEIVPENVLELIDSL